MFRAKLFTGKSLVTDSQTLALASVITIKNGDTAYISVK